jgi:membrane fusion protein (multidrug efflux system)
VRPVTLGDWVDVGGSNQWVVESGLKAGDRVIVDGLAKLRPGAPIMLGEASATGSAAGAAGNAAPGAPPAPAAPAAAPKSAPKS